MEQVNFWQTLAQSGVAILVLSIAAWLFWKQIQSLMGKQDERTKALEQNFATIQKDKDELQKQFTDYIKEASQKSMDFINATQAKNAEIEHQWMKTIQENTEILKDLKQLIEKKF